jgi:hypothetical protein
MPPVCRLRTAALALVVMAFLSLASTHCRAQAALLMEEPYGFFGTLNPTGHDAIYFARICAETPVKLRRCEPGEMGVVIARYSDIAKYDWVAIPLIPYLFSVEDPAVVADRVDRETVNRVREQYHEAHLLSLGENIRRGGFLHGGWAELVGVSYERRMYAFRFDTTEEQDDAFIVKMNADENRSHFQLFFSNCADFSRAVLNFYFPRSFGRSVFPDAGVTTPKQIAYKLVKLGRKHPEMHLQVYDIPQVPGYRRHSRSNKSIAESLVTTGYAIPITVLCPYLAGGLLVDFLVRGHFNLIPKDAQRLSPNSLATLTFPAEPTENPVSASIQVHSAAPSGSMEFPSESAATSGLKEVMATHE